MKKLLENKIIKVTLVMLVIIFTLAVIDNYRGIINIASEKYALMHECVPVLTYHGLMPNEVKNSNESYASNIWIDDIEGFEEQMKYLYDNGWTTLSADEFYDWHEKKIDIPEKTCMITFDDGFYETYYLAYPILKKYNFKATVFIVGTYTPELTSEYDPYSRNMIGWDKINEIHNEYPNIRFESHSYDLHGFDENGKEPWMSATLEELKQDFKTNQQLFDFKYIAYPYGGYNDRMLEAVEESDIKMAFTFKTPNYATQYVNKYKIPRQKILADTTYNDFIKIVEKVQ